MLKKYRLLAPDTGSNPTGGEPQAGDPTTNLTPQAGDTTSTEPQAGDSPIETISLEEAKKLRSEAKSLRAREKDLAAKLKAFEDAEQKVKDANLSEVELTKKQYAELQAQHESLAAELVLSRMQQEIARHAAKLNFQLAPDMLARLIEDEVEFEQGKPTNIEALLVQLAKDSPGLIGKAAAPTSGGATNPSRSSSTAPQTLSIDYVGKIMAGGQKAMNELPPEERARVRAWIQGGGMLRR